MRAALVANFLIAVFKLFAALISGSSALLAETYHSFSDTFNQVLLLFGVRASQTPADSDHPFGYGKARYFYSFVVAVMIFGIAGTLSLFEGVSRLITPRHQFGTFVWGYYALAFAAVFEGYALAVSISETRRKQRELEAGSMVEALSRSKDPTLMTVFVEDSVALAGIGMAAIGLYLTQVTGNPLYDAGASVLIGLTLMAFALVLAKENKDLLIGESMDPAVRIRIVRQVEAHPQVVKVVDLKTMHLAPKEAIVNIEVNFKDGLTTDEVERAIEEVEGLIRKTAPYARHLSVKARGLADAKKT